MRSIPMLSIPMLSIPMLSIIVPIFNELDNLEPLHAAISAVARKIGSPYELLFIDDGSRDGSSETLDRLAAGDTAVKVVHFRRNFGQTAAMSAGLRLATGEVIVLVDGDLQNDPQDIPLLLAKLDEGYDLVHGWRRHRQDPWLSRKLPSRLANWLISRVTGFAAHDLGCTLKAMRREIAGELRLYGEMHRFIPILAHWRGARCAEVVVRHHLRQAGRSKYGLSRTGRVLLDLITVNYMVRYQTSPMKLFGGMGLLSLLTGGAAAATTVAMKLRGTDMTGNPLLLLTVFASLAGLQFLVLGILGEVAVRIYYESQDLAPYAVRSLVNFDEPSDCPGPTARAARAA